MVTGAAIYIVGFAGVYAGDVACFAGSDLAGIYAAGVACFAGAGLAGIWAAGVAYFAGATGYATSTGIIAKQLTIPTAAETPICSDVDGCWFCLC